MRSEVEGDVSRVLVTGIHGFTGLHLSAALEQAGHEVYGTVRAGEPTGAMRLRADLTDPQALRDAIDHVQPHHIVHLAAVSFVAHGDVQEIYRTNIVGTRNLLQALASSRVAKSLGTVLLASSGNIYGHADAAWIDETQALCPSNDYAVSKVAMEQMAALWADQLPITVVRPFNYTGQGQSRRFLIPKIVHAFAQRQPVLSLGNLDVYRDFTDVRDVVQAYVALLQASPRQTLNVCSGHVHSVREILAMAQAISGHVLEVQVDPLFVRQNEVRMLRGSAKKLQQWLPQWQPRPLQETIAWMLSGSP